MKKSEKTILLIETRLTGHRPSYLRRLINILVAHNYHTVVAMPSDCFEHPVAQGLLEKYSTESLTPLPISSAHFDRTKLPSNQFAMLINEYRLTRFYKVAVAAAKKNRHIDLIFICMLDDVAIYSGLVGLQFNQTPWLGIVMRQNFHFSTMGAIGPAPTIVSSLKKLLFFRLLRSISKKACIMTIDQSLQRYVALESGSLSGSIRFLPDPVDDRQVSKIDQRDELGIPDDAFVILVYGSLRVNKGVRLLIDLMHQLPDQVHVMLIGTQEPVIQDYLTTQRNRHLLESRRLLQVDRYIDVTEDSDFFEAADLVWVGYRNHYAMSAVLVQSAQYNRPVIASRNGLIGSITSEFKTGIIVDTDDQENVLQGIKLCMSGQVTPTIEQYEHLANAHCLAKFEKHLLDNVNHVFSY